MNKIIQADFNGQAMHFTTDAWFNATEAAEKYGKRPVDWLNQDGTREYIATLADMLKCEPGSLLKTKRGNNGGTWMHPKLAVAFSRWLDTRLAIWCDMQIDGLIRGTAQPEDWRKFRIEASSRFKGVCEMLSLTRQADGKITARHHYINEARLINWAFAGSFAPIERDRLSAKELRLLERLEAQDMVLLGRGIPYEERKAALLTFAQQQRQSMDLPMLAA
ncbi:KilA-N domain-containing protein [Vogesella sp. DC21W]|uniref:KilA-N domain-containing protein n=1 Tax=Vogesella aquatica TaxID=2984206 RepID=A0ABT5J1M4_9NEIS|nr:KilA-N domain-containing protein [Vogesella aquatica]MDC7718734.1 KilA-N domain-containing protein [Vogesella aquatica]